MGDILPDGTIQGYSSTCPNCKRDIKVNMQGDIIDDHKCLTPEQEERRKAALQRAEDAYQDRSSPHYRDNERFSWAVKTINKSYYGKE